jgi:hypothetical protein
MWSVEVALRDCQKNREFAASFVPMIRPASLLLSLPRKSLSSLSHFVRSFSNPPTPLTKLTVRPDGIAVIEMNRPAVNSLNRELMADLTKSLLAAADDKNAKAVVRVPRLIPLH